MQGYWIIVISPENFNASKSQGFTIAAFKDNILGRRSRRMKPGDLVIFYISQICKFGAVACVTGSPYRDDHTRIRPDKDETWPLRVPIKPVNVIENDSALVDVRKMASKLSFVSGRLRKANFGRAFQISIRTVSPEDFKIISSAIEASCRDAACRVSEAAPNYSVITEDYAKRAIAQLNLSSNTLHDRIGEMLAVIGSWMGYRTYTRHRVTPEHSVELDVAWLRGSNPHVGIEVQIGGSIVEAKDRLDQARRFNYRKVIMVVEENQLSKLNARIRFDELRFWLDAWSIQAVYRLYMAGEEFFSLYARLDESRYIDRRALDLVK
ncbi:MAG: EVE domain-containing protein [Armatimonadota bacterium]|jgi:predicted RNA-binding protein with PUA-like domain|nr:hypothetical protein [Armatimonadota bacterium]